jgi:bla regulator protein blaR1
MPAALSNLVAYSCGLSLIAIASWLAATSARIRAPRVLLLQAQLTLIVAVLLPLVSLLQPAKQPDAGLLPMVAAATGVGSAVWSARPALTTLLAAVLAAGAVLRFAWLAIGCLRLRRWRLSATPLDPMPEILVRLEGELDVRVRWFVSDRLMSAATYGLWRPAVLLPKRDLVGPEWTLGLIARHELLHVRRRDWLLVVLEECLQAALWFEPAVWLLIDRIRLYREQAVDEEVVHTTRQSETYARALIAGAGLEWILSPRPASHWLRARHLRQRIQAIVNGGTMSRVTLVKWTCLFGLTLVAAGYSAVQAFPLQGSGTSQNERHVYSAKDPGVVLPTIVREVKPQYTQEAIDAHIEGFVKLAIIIEADGSVSDVRITESLDPTFGLDDEAVKAAWQWSFKPATKDGKPVAVGVELELRFLLK